MAALVREVVGDVLRGAQMSRGRLLRCRRGCGICRDRARSQSLQPGCSVRFVRLCSSRCRWCSSMRASGWRVKRLARATPAGRATGTTLTRQHQGRHCAGGVAGSGLSAGGRSRQDARHGWGNALTRPKLTTGH